MAVRRCGVLFAGDGHLRYQFSTPGNGDGGLGIRGSISTIDPEGPVRTPIHFDDRLGGDAVGNQPDDRVEKTPSSCFDPGEKMLKTS